MATRSAFEEAIRIVFETAGAEELTAIQRMLGELGEVSDETRDRLSGALDQLIQARQAQQAAQQLGVLIERQRELADATDAAGLRLKLAAEAEAAAAEALRQRAAAVEKAKAEQAAYAQQADRLVMVEKELAAAVQDAVARQQQAEAEWRQASATLKAASTDYERAATAQEKLQRQMAPLVEALGEAGVSTEDLGEAQRELTARADEARDAFASIASSAEDMSETLGSASETTEEAEERIRRMVAASLERVQAEKQSAAAREQAARAEREATTATEKAVSATERLAGAQDTLGQSARQTIQDLQDYEAVLQRGARSLDEIAEQEARLDRLRMSGAITVEEYDKALEKLTRDEEALARASREAEEGQAGLASTLDRTKQSMLAAAAAAYGYFRSLSGASRASADLETAMAAIGTIARSADIPALTSQVEALARQFGGPAASQAKALYEIIAGGVEDTAEAMRVLEAANKVAIGGLTSVDNAAKGLLATLNAYSLGAEDATRVADAFFVSAATGKADIDSLAASIGNVAPLAASAGVSFEELLAAVGALTKTGLTTSQAMTQVESMLAAVVKPTEQARAKARELGIEFDTGAIKAQTFARWLAGVAQAAGGSETDLARLFGRVEGLQGVLTLTGSQAETFAQALAGMRGEVSATEEAYGRMADTFEQRSQRFEAAWDGLKRAVGDVVNAMLVPLMETLTAVINGFLALPEPVQNAAIAVGLLATGGLTLLTAMRALAPVVGMVGGAIGGLVAGARGAAGALSLLTTGMNALRLASIGVIVGGSLWLYDTWSGWIQGAREAEQAQRELEETTRRLRSQIEDYKDRFRELAELQIRSREEVERLSKADLTAYSQQLDGAAKYWRAIEIEAKRAGDEQRRAFARERAQEYQQALEGVEAALKSVADTSRDTAEDLDKALRQAFKDLGIVAQRELEEAASKAAEALYVIARAAEQGKAAQEDVRRAFDAWAGAARAAAKDSDAAGQAAVEAQIEVQRAALVAAGVLQQSAAAAKGEIAGIGQSAEQAARKMIASMEAARAAIAAQAQDIAKRLAEAMNPDTGDASKVPGLQRQMQALDAQIDNLNQRIAQTKQQLQDAGNTGTQAGEDVQQSMQGVAQAAQDAGNAADAAGEQVGRFGRGGAVEELRQAIAAVRSEFEALGTKAAQAFDDALIQAARGANRLHELFAAVNEAAAATRQAYAAQQEEAARQAEELAKLTEDAIRRMVESGTTADGLRARVKRLADQFDLLNEQDLGTLRAALEQAAGKIDALNDKARAAREALEDMNRQLQEEALREAGREEELAKLRRDRELQRIKELAEQAGEANSQVVQENIRMIEERYRRELELIRERAKAEKNADREVAEERRRSRSGSGGSERSRGGGSGGSRGSGLGGERQPERQVERVIRVQIPDVGDVDVADENSVETLLNAIALSRRAARRF